MTVTTSVKLPQKLKARVAKLAKQTGRSSHSLIVEAVERHTAYEERLRAFVMEARVADAEMDASGEAYAAQDVHDWLEKMVEGRAPARPKPCRR